MATRCRPVPSHALEPCVSTSTAPQPSLFLLTVRSWLRLASITGSACGSRPPGENYGPLRGTALRSTASPSHQIANCLLREVMTRRFACGMSPPARNSAACAATGQGSSRWPSQPTERPWPRAVKEQGETDGGAVFLSHGSGFFARRQDPRRWGRRQENPPVGHFNVASDEDP